MEDWSSDDYTRVYGGVFYVPEQTASVYLLDEAGEAADRAWDPQLRVPINRYEYAPRGMARPCGTTPPRPAGAPHGQREGFYGNIVSERGDGQLARVYNAAWDERPMHYNPNAGTDWAHLVPSRYDRPYYGGPAPSLAYPILSQSEGVNRPWASSWPGAPSAECRDMRQGRPWPDDPPSARPAVPTDKAASKEKFGGGQAAPESKGPRFTTQDAQMFILVVVIVLLSVALMSANRNARSLEKLLKKSFRAGFAHARGVEIPEVPAH